MSELPTGWIFPHPTTQFEKDLLVTLEQHFRGVSKILDRGILFSDNVDCQLVTLTTSATPDAENTTAHGLGKVPTGFIVYSQDKAGSLYDGSTSNTATNLYTKCDVASVTFKIIVF